MNLFLVLKLKTVAVITALILIALFILKVLADLMSI